MEEPQLIIPPVGEDDTDGARRIFSQFFTVYQPDLLRIEAQLELLVSKVDPAFSEAYKPWLFALDDLLKGSYLLAKKIPLPNPDSFLEALSLFSIESAIEFLRNICVSCRLILTDEWVRRFRQHIDLMLFAFAILTRNQQPNVSR